MALDLGGNKKKQNDKSKYSIVELSLFKPGKKKYSEFDYEEIRKKQLKEDDSSGDDERFHDREALEIVKRLEAKYGGKKNKKGRKLCFGTEDDYMDKRAGYDLEDDFIDDSEAYDELVPSTMDTVQGGFYVNRGKLEFKTKLDEVNDSDISDVEEGPQQKKGTKRAQISSDDEVEIIQDTVAPPTASTSAAKTLPEEAAPPPVAPKPRMVGAPPTKVRRMALGESPNQRAANAIKKRLVGMPPTLLKRKVLQNAVARKENEMSDFLRTMAGGDIPIDSDIIEVAASSSMHPVPAVKTPEKPLDASTTVSTSAAPSTSETAPTSSNTDTNTSTAIVPPSPKKRPLAPMTETLSSMIEEFKRCTNNLALPGQKKRLQNIHVDMVIAIEEQCLKDGYSVHEKARVAHSLADYCGIQKNSLYARCIKRRDEHKNGAPNLAFLSKKLSGTPFANASGSTNSNKPAASTSAAVTVSNKTTTSVAPSSVSVKSTTIPTSVTTAPSPSKSTSVGQLPTTSASPATAPPTSAVHTPVASQTSVSSNSVSNSVSPQKPNQAWTNQKKLTAQSMITNVASLPSFSGRVGELQDMLKKVANESITYEEILKWHETCMKSASVKPSSEQKTNANGVAKQNPTPSTSCKSAGHGSDGSAESLTAAQARSSPDPTILPVKKITLAQAVASSKLPPRMRPMTISSSQITEKFETQKQMTIRAVTTAIENSKVAHKKKCETAAAAGKPTPRCDFLWTENLARALRMQIDLYWSVLLSSDTYPKATDGIVTIFMKEVYPYFKGEIKLSRLFVEYARRCPEKAFILSHQSVQKILKDDDVDLNNITVVVKKEKTGNDAATSKVNSSRSYKRVLPVRSSSPDDIQVIAVKTASSPHIQPKSPFAQRNPQK